MNDHTRDTPTPACQHVARGPSPRRHYSEAEFALVLVAGAGIVHMWLTLHLTLNTHGDGLEISVGHLTWQEQYRLGGRNEGANRGQGGN